MDDVRDVEVCMRSVQFILLLVFAALPAPLLAQVGGATGGVSAPTIATTVESQVEAATFVGGGRPSAFVGTADIFTRTASSSRTTRTATTTTRPRTMTTAVQRQTSAASRMTAVSGNLAGQVIQSATSFDFDLTAPRMQRPLPAIETGLTRIQGIQDGQVALAASPAGTTAVLTGTVASDRARRVAQQLLLLEPGIDRVENLLEVR